MYYLGIDGGGTKTHCILANQDGKILYEGYGGNSNFLLQGVDTVSETIYSLVESVRSAFPFNYPDILSFCIGTTGAGRENDANRLREAVISKFSKHYISFNDFFVVSDARIALEAAFPGVPGAILIAGTGSIMFGKDSAGNIHRVGGFGRFIGDEGSGSMIGRKGLIALARELDGRGEKTLISEFIREKFNISDVQKLITEIYSNNFEIASVAPLVLEAASKGDTKALQIVNDEATELVTHIKAMQKMQNDENLKIAFIGGLIANETMYSKILREKIIESLPTVDVINNDNSPAMGAIFMAMQRVKPKS